MERVTEIRFIPVTNEGSMVGYIDFSLDGNLTFKDMALHKRLDGKGYRVVYRKNQVSGREYVKPQNRETQQAIDDAVSKFMEDKNER